MKNENKCTKPNCDCAEKEMIKQSTEFIKSYPCLASHDFDELKSEFKKPESKEVESVPVKSAEEILNYSVGLNGYPHLLSLLTRMPRSEQGQFIISCMETYASQFKSK